MPLNSHVQWDVGIACMSGCVCVCVSALASISGVCVSALLLSSGRWQQQESEKLKLAVVSRRRNIFPMSVREGRVSFPAAKNLPESAQTLAGIACPAARKSGKTFAVASKFAGRPFQQGISDSHSLRVFLSGASSHSSATLRYYSCYTHL